MKQTNQNQAIILEWDPTKPKKFWVNLSAFRVKEKGNWNMNGGWGETIFNY